MAGNLEDGLRDRRRDPRNRRGIGKKEFKLLEGKGSEIPFVTVSFCFEICIFPTPFRSFI